MGKLIIAFLGSFLVLISSLPSSTRDVHTIESEYDCLLVTKGGFRYHVLNLRTGERLDNPLTSYGMYAQPNTRETSPTGRYTAYLKPGDLWATTFDLVVDDTQDGSTVVIQKDVARISRSNMLPAYPIGWSPDENWVVFSTAWFPAPDDYLLIFKPDGSLIQRYNRSIQEFKWSLDGRYLALLEFTEKRVQKMYLWMPGEPDWTTIPMAADRYISEWMWSPTADELAFIEEDAIDQSDPILRIYSPEVHSTVSFPITQDRIYFLEPTWSPDGQFFTLQFHRIDDTQWIKLYPHLGGEPIQVMNRPGREEYRYHWVPNEMLTYWTFDAVASQHGLTVFDPYRRETVFSQEDLLDHFWFPPDWLLIERYDDAGRYYADFVNLAENWQIPVVSGAKRYLSSQFYETENAYLVWVGADEVVWLTRLQTDSGEISSTHLDIPAVSGQSWRGTKLAYYGSDQAGLIDVETGRQFALFEGGAYSLYGLSANVVGFVWTDEDQARKWLDIYGVDGSFLYRLPAVGSEVYLSPDEQVWVMQTTEVQPSSDVPLYGMSFAKPGDNEARVIRSHLQSVGYGIWSPDGEQFAFPSVDQAGVYRLDVVSRGGDDIAQFDHLVLPEYADLEWAECRSLIPTDRSLFRAILGDTPYGLINAR